VAWTLDGTDATITASGQTNCTIAALSLNPQATRHVLTATFTYEDGRGTVSVSHNIMVGMELYGNRFGDILLSNGQFERPVLHTMIAVSLQPLQFQK
jgi:hypothetical protein